MTEERRYRPNVAVVIVNDRGELLACERSDRRDAWQLPQGGINPGESVHEAALRELREEIGTDRVEILMTLPQTIRYDWPGEVAYEGYHGQEQSYVLARFLDGATIDLAADEKPEFQSVRWMSVEEFVSRLSGFKREAYIEALKSFCRSAPQLLKHPAL